MEKNKGSKGNQYTPKLDRGHDVSSPTLQDLGIHRMQSMRWQQIADLPEESFENKIEVACVPNGIGGDLGRLAGGWSAS